MRDIKDWTQAIEGLGSMEGDAVLQLYSDMLATAHDIDYKVPDDQLIETEDADQLRAVIPALHTGLIDFHATAKAEAKTKAKATKVKPKKTAAANAAPAKTAKTPTKPSRTETQKVDVSEKTNMATATAKKTAAKKAPAKKAAAKKAAPAKAGKKAAKANARTPATGGGRNPFGESAVIKVVNKDHGIKPDSERGKRVAVVMKYNGKKASAYFTNEKPPFNRTDTLRYLIDRKVIEVK